MWDTGFLYFTPVRPLSRIYNTGHHTGTPGIINNNQRAWGISIRVGRASTSNKALNRYSARKNQKFNKTKKLYL